MSGGFLLVSVLCLIHLLSRVGSRVWKHVSLPGHLSTLILHSQTHPAKDDTNHELLHSGGSTVIVLYPPGEVVLDEDLVKNSTELNVETLMKVGWRTGIKQ